MGKSNVFSKKFSKQSKLGERKQGVRQERQVDEALPLLSFNFKDFDQSQIPPGQSFEDWQKKGYLSKLMTKFKDVCQCNIVEAQQRGYLTIYNAFPPTSDFKVPTFFQGEVKWAVIKDIGGQKPRLAGYIDGSVFYVVFLDMNHVFYKMQKKG